MNRYCRKKVVDLYVVGTIEQIFELFISSFFVGKIWEDKEKSDKYYPVTYVFLYGNSILEDKQMKGILGTKERSAEIDNESKSRDDDKEL